MGVYSAALLVQRAVGADLAAVSPATASTPSPAGLHDARLSQVWLLRYTSVEAATARCQEDLALALASGDERLRWRSEMMLLRLRPVGTVPAPRYDEMARRLEVLGDRAGSLIARSLEIATAYYGGDVATAAQAYEALSPELALIPHAVERFMAMAPGLYLYQATGQFGSYMELACQLMRLASEVDHEGMRMSASANLGIAYYLAGDELQAREHLEESLSLGSASTTWARFGVVVTLVEIHVALGEYPKAQALLATWSFPPHLDELDLEALRMLHALGAEVYARLGHVAQAQRYLDYLGHLPDAQGSREYGCQLTLARALVQRAQGQPEAAQQLLRDVLRPGTPAEMVDELPLAGRYWHSYAELARDLGQWEQACRHLEHHRLLERATKHQTAQARRIAARFQAEVSRGAVEQAQRDQLTGLANRDRLRVVGDAWISRQQANPVVVVMNLRRFNAINKALGREVGDAVLQAVGERLRELAQCCAQAVAARVYADQFAMLVVPPGPIDALQARLRGAFAAPLEVAGQFIDLSAAFGLAQYPQDGTSMQALMSNAEIALHEGRRGQADWTRFDPSFCHDGTQQLSMVSELQRAARQGEFVLMLQPKFSLPDGRVSGAESLLRWQHPSRGLLPPADFIPFAESTGSIRGITEWVLEAAMRQARAQREAGCPCQLAVNISAHDIDHPGLLETLQRLLSSTGALASELRLELTESVAMKDPAAVVARMREISALGLEWSIDDFGTGQSSLGYLHNLPVSELKIDRSFVRGATRSTTSLTLLKAAVELGANLGLSTVAEGVETAEEWQLLRSLGCAHAQGWYGAPPMPASAFIPWLQARMAQSGPASSAKP